LFSFANLILSIMLVQKFGLLGVAGATAFTQILFYAVVTPVLTSRAMKFSIIDYLKETYLKMIPASLMLFVILAYFDKFHPPTGYLMIIGQALLGAVLYLAVVYWTLLSASDRGRVKNITGKLTSKVSSKLPASR